MDTTTTTTYRIRTIEQQVADAIAGRRRARADLADAIYWACAAGELPIGATLGELRVTRDTVPCSQSGDSAAGWREVSGSAHTLTWRGEVVDRGDASHWDGHNRQIQYWPLATNEHPQVAGIAALRECAAALPALVSAYLATQAALTAAAEEATAALAASGLSRE